MTTTGEEPPAVASAARFDGSTRDAHPVPPGAAV